MKRPSLPRRKKPDAHPTRITNETVAEHRERILAGGRRFKYPLQYARRKLVRNAIIIGVAAVILFIVVCWQQLYMAQNTGTFFYRLTNFIPAPVALVDGQSVRYSDYLLYYNGSAYYLRNSEQVNFSTPGGHRQEVHIKRESLSDAEADAYAQKLAHERDIKVSDAEVVDAINTSRKSYGDISEQTYNASALSILGWSPSEYRHIVHNKLIRQKVAYTIDKSASDTAGQIKLALTQDPTADFSKVIAQFNSQEQAKAQVGTSGLVPYNNSDGGLSQMAATLQVGQVSDVLKSTTGDGYYFVKLLSKDSQQLNYTYIRVPLTVFDAQVASLRSNHKITEFISIPVDKTSNP